MAHYKCFVCDKDISPEYTHKRVRCPYCGSKILFKPREKITTVAAR